ncbi:hypothetical protein WMF04_19625 [Sorangium sp. So ce260]
MNIDSSKCQLDIAKKPTLYAATVALGCVALLAAWIAWSEVLSC